VARRDIGSGSTGAGFASLSATCASSGFRIQPSGHVPSVASRQTAPTRLPERYAGQPIDVETELVRRYVGEIRIPPPARAAVRSRKLDIPDL